MCFCCTIFSLSLTANLFECMWDSCAPAVLLSWNCLYQITESFTSKSSLPPAFRTWEECSQILCQIITWTTFRHALDGVLYPRTLAGHRLYCLHFDQHSALPHPPQNAPLSSLESTPGLCWPMALNSSTLFLHTGSKGINIHYTSPVP